MFLRLLGSKFEALGTVLGGFGSVLEPLGTFLVPFSTVLDAVRPPAGSSVARKLPNPCNTRVWEAPGREVTGSGEANVVGLGGTKQQNRGLKNRELKICRP